MPQSNSQRPRRGRDDEKPSRKPISNQESVITEPKQVQNSSSNQLSSDPIVTDISNELDNAAVILSPVGQEIMKLLPFMVDKIIDRVVPRVIETLEKRNLLTNSERLDDVARKMEDVVVRVENIRKVYTLRNISEIDKHRQQRKDKTLRITGSSEDSNTSEFLVNIAKKANIEIQPHDIMILIHFVWASQLTPSRVLRNLGKDRS